MTGISASARPQNVTAEQAGAIQDELDRILQSSAFSGSDRCHDFLTHIVKQATSGDYQELTERFIGARLYGRSVDYDTASDSIVRVRASDVRRRLVQYYLERKKAGTVAIELPPGTYIPEFHWSENPAQSDAGLVVAIESDVADMPIAHTEMRQTVIRRPWAALKTIAVLLAIVVPSIGCVTLWLQLRASQRALYPWRFSPAVESFWSGFIDDPRDTDLVLSDSSYSLVQDLGKKSFTLRDYLSRDYLNHLQDPDPKMTAALNRISSWGLGSTGEFKVAERIRALDPLDRKIHFYLVRNFMPELIKRDNVILLGTRIGDPWAELFDGRLNFAFGPTNTFEITNRARAPGEPKTYTWTTESEGYCVVAFLPNPGDNGNVLLVEGSSSEAAQAAGDFLLSEARMSNFQKTLGVSKLPYFELLLKMSWVKGTPLSTTIEAYRTYPKLK